MQKQGAAGWQPSPRSAFWPTSAGRREMERMGARAQRCIAVAAPAGCGMASKPVRYTAKIAGEILERIASGESLRVICREEGMPAHQSVLRWVLEDREGIREKYETAMGVRADTIFEEILEIADAAGSKAHGEPGTGEAGAKVQAEKLRVDSRKWYLSKLLPKRFGEKLTQEISGPDGGPIKTEARDTALEEAEAVKAFVDHLRETVQDPELRARIIGNLPEGMKEGAGAVERIAAARAKILAGRFNEGADIAATVMPPASFRGVDSEA